MKKLVIRLSLALSTLLVVILCSLTIPIATAATDSTPDYQRYITFHNDFPFPVYPVIQVPTDLCGGENNVRRILVNGPGPEDGGLQPGETVTVMIPNEGKLVDVKGVQQVRRCWYQSGRVYIFSVNLFNFEKAMVALDKNNAAQTTQYDNSTYPRTPVPCFQGKRDQPGTSGNCFTGFANNSIAADAPAQLAEYTFDSDNADANGDPDTGTPMADIDVSHVDDLYLPVAASVSNHGATGYMGGAMDLPTFRQRVSDFVTKLPWTMYSAYLSQYQVDNAFSKLLPSELGGGTNTVAVHVPGGYNTIQNTLAKAVSSVYKPTDGSNYLISGVVNQATEVQPYIDRWMSWIQGNPCTNLDQLAWPDGVTQQFNKANFCSLFQSNAQAVWNNFYTAFQQNSTPFYQDCGLPDNPDQNLQNACVIQHIVGYNPQIGGVDLPDMTDRTQRVQALLRGVAYDPNDGSQQYQFDPFLTFTVPYSSQFNLDPYTRLIHSPTDGVAAVAYSFSIDDKYGNFRDASSGFIIDAGGTTALDNQRPYDPYQQYKINWGYNAAGAGISNNWVSANLCSAIDIPIAGPGAQTLPLPFASGAYKPCRIILTDAGSNTMAFDITPESKQVTDTYTGATAQVWGLPTGQDSGSPAITSSLSPTDLQDCKSNSGALLYGLCDNVTVSAVWAVDPLQRDIVYMGLNYPDMPRVNINLPAAPNLDSGQVIWPYTASITAQPPDNGNVLVTWSTPRVAAASQPPLKYTLYLWQNGGWQPQTCADSSKPECAISSTSFGTSANLYVIAFNYTASPQTQSVQLYGCYPAANPCPPPASGNTAKTRVLER
ncbi:MAG: hypothetical protein KME07_05605 [Pegethrix bostrychoides GSE-TBD4-15B]|jgi:hypothetical protein|uniref:Fibronectin type-III domain-containing protein n=1 Tax=Pegethrix bostrychoides GSE-TBD4-15B TaxID=2839662 RepID=A0A951P9K2_9CYAN|nr:hypothetical protein [Pegethrix bostrychoides GSE-TBD4-15B]